MRLYFAPLEGITTHIYRETHAQVFGGCDAYYAPFITPSENEKISRKGLRDVVPEKNKHQNLTVQVLTNTAQSFLKFADKIKGIGYREVNLNLGCPFERVVRKGRGAGFLSNPDALDHFLDAVFSACDLKISVKTRIGYESEEEMQRLLSIYNRYPLSLLIVHPRTRADFYAGALHTEIFDMIYRESVNPVCYNGDVMSKADYEKTAASYPHAEGIMIGRGAVRNPTLFREIRGGRPLTTQELIAFTEALSENYYHELQSETFTLHKLKEVWGYMLQLYPNEKQTAKAIKKAGRLCDFITIVKSLPETEG